jgi:hypothetical protein
MPRVAERPRVGLLACRMVQVGGAAASGSGVRGFLDRHLVDESHAGLCLLGEPQPAVQVLREDGRGQAELVIVGQLEGLGLVVALRMATIGSRSVRYCGRYAVS